MSTCFSILGSGLGEGSLVGVLWRWKTWGSPSPLRPAERSGPVWPWLLESVHGQDLCTGYPCVVACPRWGSQDRLRDFLSFPSDPVSLEGPVAQGWVHEAEAP